MSVSESHPIMNLISKLNITLFDDLKKELLQFNVNTKEDDQVCLLYTNDDGPSNQVADSCRSLILDKTTLQPIGTQFNKILYNDDAMPVLLTSDWNKVVVQRCYEGTMLLVFNHNDKWYVSTRRCLDAGSSTWIKGLSYMDQFNEATKNKFTFDDLNPNYCYHFILIHYKNMNIINYSQFGQEYKEVLHVMTTEKNTLNEVTNHKINDQVLTITSENAANLNEILDELNKINQKDTATRSISSEGFIFRVYSGEVRKSSFNVYKLQTNIYKTLMGLKPNNPNIHQNYLELYQKDKLTEFIPYFTQYNTEIITRVHTAMRTVGKEILNLYHGTRKQKNQNLYNLLGTQYKKVLYLLHGVYVKHRKTDFPENSTEIKEKEQMESRAVNIHDVYYLLKNLPANELKQLFYERMRFILSDVNTCLGDNFFDKTCIYAKTQTTLMFGEIVVTPFPKPVVKTYASVV